VFENLLGQDEVLGDLKSDILSDRLPPALLFSGPPCSGKMTAALELARALSCTYAGESGSGRDGGDSKVKRSAQAPRVDARSPTGRRASWNCPCPSCSRHRILVHPDLALLGRRSFPEEIPAALELLGRAPGPAAAYFFVRAARKLSRRFDAFLYEGEESRLAKAAPSLRELEEQLDAVAPSRASAGALAPGAAEAAAKAAAACAKLEALTPEAPPVFMIRNLEFWARLAPMGSRKTVVIENADRMLEASRNALLKILEEPPESVRFVLHSSRRNAVMRTILSRVRSYQFAARDPEATALVVERVFRSSEPAASVESFLAARRPFPPAAARELAEKFLGAALASRSARAASVPLGARPAALPRAFESLARRAGVELSEHTEAQPALALAALLEATKDFGAKDERLSSSFRSFLAALSSVLSSLLREEGMDAAGVAFIEGAAALVRAASSDYETLNRGAALLAESLMYALSEIGIPAPALGGP
jgi:DNA polymerase III subunit gamma/tau